MEGKVAIITGAASGIGEAAARLFVSNGALVVIADIQDDLGAQVVASIGHDKCSYKHCDVTDEKQVEEAVQYAISTYGRLDIAYSNAGLMGSAAGVTDVDLAEMDRILAVNVRGTAAVIKHAARAMIEAGTRGSIICTASLASCRANIGPMSYTASKHAVLGLVRTATGELGKHGIRVNCVSPHGVATPLGCGIYGLTPAQFEEACIARANLKGKVLKPNDVADAALFLASDESAYVSGLNLLVDGGASVIC